MQNKSKYKNIISCITKPPYLLLTLDLCKKILTNGHEIVPISLIKKRRLQENSLELKKTLSHNIRRLKTPQLYHHRSPQRIGLFYRRPNGKDKVPSKSPQHQACLSLRWPLLYMQSQSLPRHQIILVHKSRTCSCRKPHTASQHHKLKEKWTVLCRERSSPCGNHCRQYPLKCTKEFHDLDHSKTTSQLPPQKHKVVLGGLLTSISRTHRAGVSPCPLLDRTSWICHSKGYATPPYNPKITLFCRVVTEILIAPQLPKHNHQKASRNAGLQAEANKPQIITCDLSILDVTAMRGDMTRDDL